VSAAGVTTRYDVPWLRSPDSTASGQCCGGAADANAAGASVLTAIIHMAVFVQSGKDVDLAQTSERLPVAYPEKPRVGHRQHVAVRVVGKVVPGGAQ
jgi:hypothetical protein